MELSSIGTKVVAQAKGKGFDTPVIIHIHSLRYRLADADGISAKAVIDQLVTEGILRDDNPTYVKEVRFSQEKIPKSDSERTLIKIIKA